MSEKKLNFTRQRLSNLTTALWQYIKEIVDNGRKRKHNLILIVTSILRITRTGLQWRNLEETYPPWELVYYYFRKWQADGTWSNLLALLVVKERQKKNKQASSR